MDNLHCALQIRLAKEEIFFGPGVLTLLKLTGEYESLNSAANKMNLSYSKANKMIKGTEKALGFKILDRKIGGVNGGGSTLTHECIKFINSYEKFEKKLKNFSDKLFNDIFDEFI